MIQPPIETNPGECLEPELIAALVDGTLGEGERARASGHVARCERCYFLFTETASDRRQQTGVHVLPFFSKRVSFRAAAALVSAAAAVLLIVPIVRSTFPSAAREPGLRDLVAAVGTQRRIEPRLTGGFAYAALRGPARAGESNVDAPSPDVRIAVAKIEKQAAVRREEMLGSLGAAYLVVGESDKAVPVLEESADQAKLAPRALSDLAAGYLVRASARQLPHDLARALTVADRAVKADARLAEAWFNRALALERLSLSDQAREAWQDYLKLDSTSGWAVEAQRHIADLTSRTSLQIIANQHRQVNAAAGGGVEAIVAAVKTSPHATRRWIEEQLLLTWPRLVIDGQFAESQVVTARVERVANAYAQETGDASLWDAALSVRSTLNDEVRARSLAAAHQKYRLALSDYEELRISQSAKAFRETLTLLDSGKNPFVVSAQFYLAVATYYAADYGGALADLERVSKVATARRYTRLMGLIHRMNGLIHVVQYRLGQGLDEYRAALRCFQLVGDSENEAGIHASLAEALDFVGERQAVWTERYEALSGLGSVHDPRRRHTILQGAAVTALRHDLPEAALYLQHAALQNANSWGRAPVVVNVQLNRAEVYERLGSTNLAEADLADAERKLIEFDDAGLVERQSAHIQLARGQTVAQREPVRAIQALDKAQAYFERNGGTNWPLARLHLARGRAHLAAGNEDLAEADFVAGIKVFERMRTALTSETLRSSYFEQPWDVFTEMIRLQAVRRKRAERALSFAEQARARTLLESVSSRPASPPVEPATARGKLPEGVTVLYYASLDERLLIWSLTKNQLEFVDVPIRQADLARLVDQYRVGRDGVSNSRAAPSLMALYDALIRPIQSTLQRDTRLAIVPDGVLHAVPFAALLRRETRRYLIEDYAVQVTPSMTVFQMSMNSRRDFSRSTSTSALIVGNPSARSGSIGGNLPAAESEARDIAAMYRNVELLIGPDATKARLLADAGRYDVLHFAGHAIANEEYPGLSRLLLSGEGDGAETLFAHEIGAKRFNRTSLVVLAACRTNAGPIRRGEGVFSLARPFIAAGVPAVVASLTDVDDRASHRLFVAFHRALQNGETVTEALRSAQLGAIAESDPLRHNPANWASFTVIGGLSAMMRSDGVILPPAFEGTSKGKH